MSFLTEKQLNEILGDCRNPTIRESFRKANKIINDVKYKKILCSISGGADSDVMLDICYKVDVDKKIEYVFFDTGLEYKATRDHLRALEYKYGIKIRREKPIKPIPYVAKHIGQPFVSKLVSEHIQRLQGFGFQFEDLPFECLVRKYCIKADDIKADELNKRKEQGDMNETNKTIAGWYYLDGDWYRGCVSSLKWWCNYKKEKDGSSSRFNIAQNTWLKEFMINNPPWFNISKLCCKYSKKDVAKKYYKEHAVDLAIVGIRKSEGGIRATIYKTCYSTKEKETDTYRPIFWYNDADRKEYEKHFLIKHSKCYTDYGLERTGCVGCPYNPKLLQEVGVIEANEPNLYKATCNVFKDAYEYTRQYKEFQKEQKEKMKEAESP